jgi:hypothetical protein
MKLTVFFFDLKGVSLASPARVQNDDPTLAYQTALGFRDAIAEQRKVRVLVTTVEEA